MVLHPAILQRSTALIFAIAIYTQNLGAKLNKRAMVRRSSKFAPRKAIVLAKLTLECKTRLVMTPYEMFLSLRTSFTIAQVETVQRENQKGTLVSNTLRSGTRKYALTLWIVLQLWSL